MNTSSCRKSEGGAWILQGSEWSGVWNGGYLGGRIGKLVGVRMGEGVTGLVYGWMRRGSGG